MRRFLALDQSLSSCGYALWDEGDDLPTSGAWTLADGVHNRAHGFVGIHRKLGELHRERPITILAHETPIKMRWDKVEALIATLGVVAHIESYCSIKLIDCRSVRMQDWRNSFLGKGTKGIGKDALKQKAIERATDLGMKPATHDEAEAIGILDHLLHTEGIQPPWRMANPFLPS